MPFGISAHHTTLKGQYIWIIGDYDILNYVAVFDTETHEFAQLNTNMIGRRHCGTEVIGNNLYVYGGNIASAGPALSSLQYADISYLSINDEPNGISSSITLFQNYPNPFNPFTTISFSIKQNSKIELEIFNVKGQKVKTLINEFRQSGYHSIPWNGDDAYGNKISSGLYFYKLSVDGKTEVVKKCLLVK
ncbi:MAG: T9SS type A sorting domain-containing protein [Candidatus Cloacimonetes bacterium]|nr:T9SS type A sorting domain-containing protein [Candidatus Cloacimonadota bacterium]